MKLFQDAGEWQSEKNKLPEQPSSNIIKYKISLRLLIMSATCPPNSEATIKGMASVRPMSPSESGSLVKV